MSQTSYNLLAADASATDLTESERHELLEVDRRRHALAVIADETGPLALDELATAVAERESGVDPAEPGTVSNVAVTLHHIHLPKMDDLGVVDYDSPTKRITP